MRGEERRLNEKRWERGEEGKRGEETSETVRNKNEKGGDEELGGRRLDSRRQYKWKRRLRGEEVRGGD